MVIPVVPLRRPENSVASQVIFISPIAQSKLPEILDCDEQFADAGSRHTDAVQSASTKCGEPEWSTGAHTARRP